MPLRAVVDAQVWVRTVLFPNRRTAAHRIREAGNQQVFDLVSSEPLLAEVERVLRCPRLMREYEYGPGRVERLLAELRANAEVVEISGELQLCRDPKDDPVIETAVAGVAVYVVTED